MTKGVTAQQALEPAGNFLAFFKVSNQFFFIPF